MIKVWILYLIISHGHGVAINTHDYADFESCEAARMMLNKNMNLAAGVYALSSMQCVPSKISENK